MSGRTHDGIMLFPESLMFSLVWKKWVGGASIDECHKGIRQPVVPFQSKQGIDDLLRRRFVVLILPFISHHTLTYTLSLCQKHWGRVFFVDATSIVLLKSLYVTWYRSVVFLLPVLCNWQCDKTPKWLYN